MLYYILKVIAVPIFSLLFLPKIKGRENIPKTGSVIVYSNHTSLLDPIILGCFLPRKVYFMAKRELFRCRLFGAFLRKLGAFPVNRGTADISAIKQALQILKKGKVFGIFPEGTRNKTGDLKSFAHGVASIAHHSKAVTVPVAITGGYRLFRPIRITIGKPVDFNSFYSKKSNTEVLEKMSDKMSKELLDILTS